MTSPAQPSTDVRELLRTIEANTARAATEERETTRVGPFLAAIHPTNDMIWLSYALPLSAERREPVTAETIAALRALFAGRSRMLRFEFFEPLWPDLGRELEALGLELQGKMPLMLCGPEDLRPFAAEGVVIRPLTEADDDATIEAFHRAALASFGQAQEIGPAAIAEQRESLRKGVICSAYATVDGQIAGVGSVSVGNDELVGVGTLAQFRRRGIAAAVSSRLVADHLARGAPLAWLSAGDEAAHAVYAKIGFRDAGAQMNYWDRAGLKAEG